MDLYTWHKYNTGNIHSFHDVIYDYLDDRCLLIFFFVNFKKCIVARFIYNSWTPCIINLMKIVVVVPDIHILIICIQNCSFKCIRLDIKLLKNFVFVLGTEFCKTLFWIIYDSYGQFHQFLIKFQIVSKLNIFFKALNPFRRSQT